MCGEIAKSENLGDLTMDRAIVKEAKTYKEWRRHLHKHPELSFEEKETVRFICAQLKEFRVPYKKLAGGVVAWLDNGEGPARGLRADIDALPIKEANSFSYKSVHEGVMHACGHDGHTSMLLGATQHLVTHREKFCGRVYFIFQPAEEVGGGAQKMLDAGLFKIFPMERIYGMHNWPGLAIGNFATHSQEVMAAVDFFDITIRGGGGHAAMPHLTQDPLVAACGLVNSLQTIVSRNVDPNDAVVLSITSIQAGAAYNVIPSEVKLKGTLRYFSRDAYKLIQQRINAHIQSLRTVYGFELEFIIHTAAPATINDPDQAELSAQAAEIASAQTGRVLRNQTPSLGAEDFSYMLNVKPGSYIWLGNGDTSSLHAPDYDFNDDALIYGVNYWVEMAARG